MSNVTAAQIKEVTALMKCGSAEDDLCYMSTLERPR